MRLAAAAAGLAAVGLAMPALCELPGGVEITCDVDRREFRTVSKNETDIAFRVWDSETGGSQIGGDYVIPMTDLQVFKEKTEKFDGVGRRKFARVMSVLGDDTMPFDPGSGPEAWLDVTVGTTTLTCDYGSDSPLARRRLQSVAFAQKGGPVPGCTSGMVSVADICVDIYEASVWSTPTGGTQFGATSADYPCAANANDCTGTTAIYARSVAGVTPSRSISWFQAQQACATVGKRLLTNGEWQTAAAGTPDGVPCIVNDLLAPGVTGTVGCVSNWGTFDMVGNVWEWVADWAPRSPGTDTGWGAFSDDEMAFAGAVVAAFPAALLRGGTHSSGLTKAGVFAVQAATPPSESDEMSVGFRCARNR